MTVPATARRAGPYTGTGTQTAFPFGFRVFSSTDVRVALASAGVEVTLTPGTQYTVAINPDQDTTPGGTVNVATAPTVGQTLAIVGGTPYTQTLDLPAGGNYSPIALENALDRTVFQIQRLAEEQGRTLTLPVATSDVSAQLPPPEAGRVIGWDDTASGLRNIDPETLASIVAFASWRTDVFNGTGAQTVFTLASDPGTASNCDVAVAGVTKVAGVDFTVSGATLTFTSAPAAGTGNIAVRYGQALPTGVTSSDAVTFDPSLNYALRTIGASVSDGPSQLIWFVVSEAERAAVKAGTSTADHTTLIQAAMNAVGARGLHFGSSGWRWNISATLTGVNGATYSGKAKIRAITNAAITGAMLKTTAKTGVTIKDLEFDANGDNNGANYGIWFSGGSGNLAQGVYVHDTRQAGISVEEEDGTDVLNCRVIDCGRATSVTGGTATDNHGVMVYSIAAGGLKNIEIAGNRVSNAYRKGITTYSAAPGTVVNVTISGNICSGCGVTALVGAGIYVANAPAAAMQDTITIVGNECSGNYVNYDLNNCYKLSGVGNVSRASAGAQGVIIGNCQGGSFGVVDYDARTGGIKLDTCLRFSINGCVVVRPNRSAGGFGAGIELASSAYCTAHGVSAFDESSGNLMTHGIIESGSCDHNHIIIGRMVNATAANVTIVGANTLLLSASSNRYGINVATPLDTLHIAGTMTFGEAALTLANGANQNVALPTGGGTFISNAPTGAYNIGGFQGGVAGREIVIVNYTSQNMTLNHADAGSTAGNRMALKNNTNLVVPTLGAVRLRYSVTGGSAWFVID